jgi:hypothetical protein
MVSYIQQVLGYPTLKEGYLNMLAHVLYGLKSISEVRVTAHKHCHIVEVIPGKI